MLLVNELLFAYSQSGLSSKFNLLGLLGDEIQQRIPYSHHCLPSCFALSSTRGVDPVSPGRGPKPGNFNKFIIIEFPGFADENGSDVLHRTGRWKRADSPGVSADGPAEAERESPRNMLRANFISTPFP